MAAAMNMHHLMNVVQCNPRWSRHRSSRPCVTARVAAAQAERLCYLAKDVPYEPVLQIAPPEKMQLRALSWSPAVRLWVKCNDFEEQFHTHTAAKEVYVLKGQYRMDNVTKGVSYLLGPGDFVRVPGGHVHRGISFGETEFINVQPDGPFDGALAEGIEPNIELPVYQGHKEGGQ